VPKRRRIQSRRSRVRIYCAILPSAGVAVVRTEAVLFDLWGTLVPPFPMREHLELMHEIAGRLNVDPTLLVAAWRRDFPRRMRGDFRSTAEHLTAVAALLEGRTDPEAIEEAAALAKTFTRRHLAPKPGALELLAWLKRQHIVLGLVSNCAADVAEAWPQTVLAPYFDYAALSCREGVAKPEAAIYRRALTALGVAPDRTLYVGDGSDGELGGALRCGLRAVLFVQDLSNTYDSRREDVDNWTGPTITAFSDLLHLL